MATFFLAGVYGVGKSTLGNKMSAQTGIPYYSAGDLISRINGEKYGANKVVADKNENQNILADCIAEILRETSSIILAGHFCIINSQGSVDKLPEDVFDKLQIEKIILLETDQHTIMAHLSDRDGKEYSLELIGALMKQERELAQKIAEHLSCPLIFHQMKYSEIDVAELIEEF